MGMSVVIRFLKGKGKLKRLDYALPLRRAISDAIWVIIALIEHRSMISIPL